MPRSQGQVLQNKFTQGLITESIALAFPQDACTETLNCVFDETGRVTRRLGFEYEPGAEDVSTTPETGEVWTEFRWNAVREQGSLTFLVQQRGAILKFFDISTSTNVSEGYSLNPLEIDLNDFVAQDSTRNPALFVCQYASGIGELLVANSACDPIRVFYNPSTGQVEGEAILVRHRDFDGLDDGMADNFRPTSTVANLQINEPEHYYNILNQGWYIADALAQWDTARSDLPSNQDYVSLYRNTETDAFDNARVTAQSTGTTLAVKGHFILTAWDLDRYQAVADEGLGSLASVDVESQVGAAVGTPFENHDTSVFTGARTGSSLPAVFDGSTSTIASGSNSYAWIWGLGNTATSGKSACVGKDFSAAPKRISKVQVYGGSDHGFAYGYNINQGPIPSQGTLTLTLRAASTAPTNANFTSHGTSLGTASFTDSSGGDVSSHQISSSDQATFWNYVWVVISVSGFSANFGRALGISDLLVFDLTTVTNTLEETYTIERPSTVEFFAGRAWWGGIKTKGRGNKIYFSQIVETPDMFGQCYQKNDPTAENFTDLLPSDGGVIRIPEMANLTKLFAYGNSLIVLATNGVWQIQGSNNNAFLPTDFVVKRISSIGTSSPLSTVSFRGVPVWWAEDGIYTVKLDASYGSLDLQNLTDLKIASLIESIPTYNKGFVKGTYDSGDTVVYFIYNDAEDITNAEYTYNKVLAINGLTGAFYLWEIPEDSGTLPTVNGISYVVDVSGVNDPKVKYTVSLGNDFSFAEVRSDTYKDWSSDVLLETDYTSYFITGYAIDGKAQTFFQPNYIWVYGENVEDASCFVQGIFDFTTSGSSGKWSSRQQVFKTVLYSSVNHRRLKIRGKGKAMQLKFTSEEGKPFTIIGWAIWETANAQP